MRVTSRHSALTSPPEFPAVNKAAIERKQARWERYHYIIRGGVEGRERLRVLARVMRPTTLNLFDRVGIRPGMACLDVGCGGGDVTFELADLVGPKGRVV
jgi:2-polyprenyl-3-methyl-5-hydroxy-6-metoxy-1,4-benzoquinol methylase